MNQKLANATGLYMEGIRDGHTQTDGPTEVTDEDKTEQNKALVTSFVDDVLVNHQVEKIADYVSRRQYVQHNPMVPNPTTESSSLMSPEAARVSTVCGASVRNVGDGSQHRSIRRCRSDGSDGSIYALAIGSTVARSVVE